MPNSTTIIKSYTKGSHMNIFHLDTDTQKSAQYHCDKHIVKMITEYCQLLSTAHRVLDGTLYYDPANKRKIKRWRLDDPYMEQHLFKASFVNHPCAVWVRESVMNYNYLLDLFVHCLNEYTYRYNKDHASGMFFDLLEDAPQRTPSFKFTTPPQAMPDDCKQEPENYVQAYRTYYIKHKNHFAKWKNREEPIWYKQNLLEKQGAYPYT